jgi:hypothetical protein
MSVTGAPDHLMQDGASQAVVTATVRNAQGEPVSGLGINWFGRPRTARSSSR